MIISDSEFIGSDESNTIYQVDKAFKIKNQFSLNVSETFSAISCDPKSDSSVVYTSHENENKVLKWDYAQGRFATNSTTRFAMLSRWPCICN